MSSWSPIDLSAVIDGSYSPPRPTVGNRIDGVSLFYKGRVHAVVGDSESGKTWLVLAVACDELAAGNAVLYVDFEDDEGGIAGRLLALGAHPDAIRDRFAYIRPDEPINGEGNHDELAEIVVALTPTFAVLDGITEGMTLHGLDLRDNTDVAVFGQLLPRWLAAQGPAVAGCDHVVKDREGRGRYALGGVHKLNAINGAQYVLENRQPFGIGVTGRSGVYITKDRPGQLRRHALPAGEGRHWFADLIVEPIDPSAPAYPTARLIAPQPIGDWRPTVLMARVSEALTKAGRPLGVRDVLDRVQGKRDTDIRRALAALVDDGYVQVDDGPRGAKLHTLVKPFGDDQ
jgi:hypothetical protein